MSLKIYPYKMASESATSLAGLLNIKKVRANGTYVPKTNDIIIGWGNGAAPSWMNRAEARRVRMLNKPAAVNIAGNKLSTLQKLKHAGINVPDFTTDINVARRWISHGHTIVERHSLRGNSGDGIRVVGLHDEEISSTVNAAPLYTKFVPKTKEFRVHVFGGEVIDMIEKKKVLSERRDHTFNKYVSSIHQGWVFSRTGMESIPAVKNIAVNAVRVLGLDFGAVDIIFYDGLPYVLEVNTAPGLTGTTLIKYANAFKRLMGLSDLSPSEVERVMTSSGESSAPFRAAAISASAGRQSAPPSRSNSQAVSNSSRPAFVSGRSQERHAMSDMVTLTVDRFTALKLKALLNQLV